MTKTKAYVNVRLFDSTYQGLKQLAEAQDRPMTEIMEELVQAALAEQHTKPQ